MTCLEKNKLGLKNIFHMNKIHQMPVLLRARN